MFNSLMLIGALSMAGIIGDVYPDDQWRWTERDSNIMSYLMRGSDTYDVRLSRSAAETDRRLIQAEVSLKGQPVFNWETHEEGTFVFSGDTLVYSNHSSIATGCEILAVDLASGETLWATQLKGAGTIEHSKYRNRINLLVRDGKVVIYGNESGGQYIEKLDLQSGEMVSNTLGTKEGNRFQAR